MSGITLCHAEADTEIAACFPALRQFRPHITGEAELLARVRRQQAEGYRLLAAWRGNKVVGAAGGRLTGAHARQPDFLTPYLGAVLATLGIRTVRFLHLEGVGSNPESRACVDGKICRWLDAHLPVLGRGLALGLP